MFIESSAILGGSTSRQRIEQFLRRASQESHMGSCHHQATDPFPKKKARLATCRSHSAENSKSN